MSYQKCDDKTKGKRAVRAFGSPDHGLGCLPAGSCRSNTVVRVFEGREDREDDDHRRAAGGGGEASDRPSLPTEGSWD